MYFQYTVDIWQVKMGSKGNQKYIFKANERFNSFFVYNSQNTAEAERYYEFVRCYGYINRVLLFKYVCTLC